MKKKKKKHDTYHPQIYIYQKPKPITIHHPLLYTTLMYIIMIYITCLYSNKTQTPFFQTIYKIICFNQITAYILIYLI